MSALSRGYGYGVVAFLLSTTILVALVSPSQAVEIIHEKGRCLWFGQCPVDICGESPSEGTYNFFNNTWAQNVTEKSDPEWFDLIKEVCPRYIDKSTDTGHVCCSATQLKLLKQQLKPAESLINRCPSCLSNFVQHYCVTTCDPDQSHFMDGLVLPAPSYPNVSYVYDVTVYLTDHYANDVYNSCANVQFAGGGAGVMSLLCGEPTSKCNSSAFLGFQGDPKKNGKSPFLIKYNFSTSTAPDKNNIVHLDDRDSVHWFYKCNESVPGKGPCSCSDCPIVCPPPPTFNNKHLPFSVIAWSIGVTGGLISFVIFIAALLASVYFGFFRRQSGYKALAGSASPPPPPLTKSVYGTMNGGGTTAGVGHGRGGNGERDPLITCSLNSDEDENEAAADDQQDMETLSALGRCCQLGHRVERDIKYIFYQWGRFVARFWFIVIFLAVVIVGALSFGLFFFTVTTDPVQLWSAPNSRARLEKNYFDKNFRPFYRTEQILIKAKPFVSGFDITVVPGVAGANWTFGPVFNDSVLLEVAKIQNHLANMEVPYDDGSGSSTNITLNDICFSPLAPENSNCTIDSVMNYFQNNASWINTHLMNFYYWYPFHIHYCTRFPFSQNDSQYEFYIPCVGQYGGDIDPKVALGGFAEPDEGQDYDYDTATVLIVTFVVNNYLSNDDNKPAMAWEKAMLDYLHRMKHELEYIDIEYSTERSIVDEINRESETDVMTILISYLLMFVYITIFLGHIRGFKTICVDTKLGVGLVGVLLVLVAVTSSLGMFAYMKIESSLIILEVVPFLVLAVGVDNLFILVHSYERQIKKLAHKYGCNWSEIPISEIIGRTVGDVAPSLLLTGLSETAAFLLGAVSVMPAVRTFSLTAGTAVFFNLLLQLSVFVAVLTLDAMRQLRNRVDLLPCIPLSGEFDPRVGIDIFSKLMKYFAKFILYPLVRPFVLLFFCLTLTTSLIFMFKIEIGLNQNLALPKDSYLIPYFNELFANLKTGSPVYFVMREGVNFTDTDIQDYICSSAGCSDQSLGNQIAIYARDPKDSGIAESPLNWLDSYFAWISNDGGCCGYLNTSTPLDPDICEDPGTTTDGIECNRCINTSRPTVKEFREFIRFFLAENPSTACASAGHAAFGDAVILEKDNMTTRTSNVMTYHDSLQTSSEFINALKRARQLSANVSAASGGRLDVFPYSVFYVYYEQYLTIVQDMVLNLGLALAAVFMVSFLLMGLNLWAAMVILAMVASIILHMLGSMALLGISANAVSLVNLVMTVGIAVEFCAHIVRWFVSCSEPTRVDRARSSLRHMGASVVSGITLTKFLGVFVLLFAKSQLFEIYYFRMYMCMLVWGALHGLVLLPVVLSFVGPPYYPNRISSPYNDANLKHIPTVPKNKQKTTPITSYDPPPPPQPSAPPAAPPTDDVGSIYPNLWNGNGQYPTATRPRDGYNQISEKPQVN